jgi:GNAT superfamily N-acetyltransferase
VIRSATPDDVGELMAMISELAAFEEMADQVEITAAELEAALFGAEPVARDTVAVAADGSLAGHALWYPTFSTFTGRAGIWLEDLYVRPANRRQGHAGALMAWLRAQTVGRVEWDVLDWNTGAISLYDGLGARPMRGWTRYRWVVPPHP